MKPRTDPVPNLVKLRRGDDQLIIGEKEAQAKAEKALHDLGRGENPDIHHGHGHDGQGTP